MSLLTKPRETYLKLLSALEVIFQNVHSNLRNPFFVDRDETEKLLGRKVKKKKWPRETRTRQ